MSKASEWAKALADAKKRMAELERDEVPNIFFPDGDGVPAAWVDTDGSPYFEKVRGRWSTENALTLAKWLTDTFDDPS